jgi:GH35 family endo-1,4-beta-xylanase
MKKLQSIVRMIGMLLFISISNSYAQTYPPSSVVTMPYSNAYFKAGTDVEIHVYSSDIGKSQNNGTVTKVEFFNGTTLLGEATSHTNYTYKFVWGCVPAGTYTIKARATNNRGVTFTSTGVIITVGTANVTQRGMSACKGKYLANIIANSPQINYNTYWNGVTAENSCKWGSIEGTRNVMNWGGADVSYNHAKNNNLMFRYHAAVWAAQYPRWLLDLNTADAKAEVVQYMEAIASRYPLIDQIDVLNEQLGNHQADNQKFRNLLGGGSNVSPTDFGWQIWLFEQARRIFPNTKLILNDYGLENDQNAINQSLNLLKVLRDRGIVDGFGSQAHCFNIDGLSSSALKNSLDLMRNAGVPIYITELDLNGKSESNTNDQVQLQSYKDHFPVYWEHPAVAGITLWGYVTGATWIGGTGLMSSSGVEKSAMTWLKSYVSGKSNVGYPICATGACSGNKVTVSITSPTINQNVFLGDDINLAATASSSDGTIANVKFYNGTTLLHTDNSAPYSYAWTDAPVGTHTIKVVATDSQGNISESVVTIKVNVPQGPYNGTWHAIPGTIQLENYDVGGNGFAYMDDSPGSSVTPTVNFRTDEDVDIENCTDVGGGYNIGYATAGEWLEYSVEVEKPGTYDLDLRVAADGTDRTVSVSMDGVNVASNVAIPNTGGWQAWQTTTVKNIDLKAGKQILRVTIGTTSYVNLNYVTFKLTKELKQEPYKGTAHTIPGRIQAEDYDLGGEGLAFHEANTNGNEGGSDYRTDEVDIEETKDTDGAYNIAYIMQGEWLEYTVNVTSEGVYDLDLRMAADGDGKTLHIEMDGKDVSGAINVPNTGGWQTWQTVTVTGINLTAGEHVMRIAFDASYMNLNYVEFRDVITGVNGSLNSTISISPNPFAESSSVKVIGDFEYQVINEKGVIFESGVGNNQSLIGQSLPRGVYILKVNNQNELHVLKLIKI